MKFLSMQSRKAFSLIEVVLVVALVAVTFVAVMGLSRRLLQMENIIKNDFIAQGLVREGLELVEAVKNTNVSSSVPMWTDLTPSADSDDYIALDASGVRIVNRANIKKSLGGYKTANSRILFDSSSSKFYQHQTGNPTAFYRTIYIKHQAAVAPSTKSSLEVYVQVDWEERGKNHVSRAKAKLYEP